MSGLGKNNANSTDRAGSVWIVGKPSLIGKVRVARHPPGIGSLLIACYRSGGFLAATLASNGGPDECHGVGSAQVYLRRRALLAIGLGDLADKGSPRHIKRVVDCGCFRPRVVLQYLNHQGGVIRDRKSTRLNSSHQIISYA